MSQDNYPSSSNQNSLPQGMGKIPPQEVELEEAVLGALMLEQESITDVIDVLHPESFYVYRHQLIYKAIRQLFNNSEPIDILMVSSQLRKTGELDKAGGIAYVTQLTNNVTSAGNIEAHARVISERSIKRELIRVASVIQKKAYDETTDVFDLLDETEKALFDVSESNIRKSYDDMPSLMAQAIRELEERKNQTSDITGVPSGFIALDKLTSGWQRSDLIIIAARPGMGKTAFILSCLRNAAVDYNMAVAIFSLEMSSVQLVNRLISSEAELEGEKLRKGNLKDYEWAQLHEKVKNLNEAGIFIDDTPALSILELRAKCRRLKAQHDIQIIVIDYLQLMSGDAGARKSGNREQEIAAISRGLKNLAKELSVPVIALSQLSRAVETRGGDKRPLLSDLRESGSIEQDADQVVFLYRPEYYGITEGDNGQPIKGVGEVIFAKNRHGGLETVPLKFIGQFTKFANLDVDIFQGGDDIDPSEQLDDIMGETKTFGSKLNTNVSPSKLGTPPDFESDENVPF